MFRKFAALLVGLILICMMMLPVFANDIDIDNDNDKAFEVVEPSFGNSNEVITKNLLINIRIYEEIPLEMTLVREEPNITNAVMRDEITTLEDTTRRMMLIPPSEDFSDIDTVESELPFDLQNNYEEDVRREVVKFYLETLKEKQSADEEFIRAYSKYKDLFYSEEEQAFIILKDMSYYEQEMILDYKKALERMQTVNSVYYELGPIYDSLFETTVLGPEIIELDGVIPFYRTVVEDIKPGDYKLIFKTDDEVIEIKEFTVKKLEEEKIKERTTDILQNVLNENDKEQ